MDAKILALERNKTWHFVPPKKGRNVIDCKWVYIKRKQAGSLKVQSSPSYKGFSTKIWY
jgi:hypothetical protein